MERQINKAGGEWEASAAGRCTVGVEADDLGNTETLETLLLYQLIGAMPWGRCQRRRGWQELTAVAPGPARYPTWGGVPI